jgi:phospholipid/cholesterol/gamma-HCH transport system substrate-binding protein
MKNTNEFKVGLFIILCILGLAYLAYSTGKLNIKKAGYNIYVVYDEVVGLEKKAPVMLNGLEVGKVEDLKVSYDNDKTQIVLKLWLDEQAKIRENPVVSIKTLGLMGEKYIQISSSQGKDFVKPETVLKGKPFLDMDGLMEQAQSISKELVVSANKLLASINGTVSDNKESIAQIIKNLEASSKNFEEFSSDIKRHPWKLLLKQKEKPSKAQNK